MIQQLLPRSEIHHAAFDQKENPAAEAPGIIEANISRGALPFLPIFVRHRIRGLAHEFYFYLPHERGDELLGIFAILPIEQLVAGNIVAAIVGYFWIWSALNKFNFKEVEETVHKKA